jgi:D-aminopeptidase
VIDAGSRSHTIGALTALNIGRREALQVQGRSSEPRDDTPAPLQGSALLVIATDAPLDDRQCRHVAAAGLMGLARLGAAPGGGDTLIAVAVSTGILLNRNDRTTPAIEVPLASDGITNLVAAAALEAAEESGVRSLTQVAEKDATADYPVFRISA